MSVPFFLRLRLLNDSTKSGECCVEAPRPSLYNLQYSFSFLGYKGMVGVDARLVGKQMRLRYVVEMCLLKRSSNASSQALHE
jgi:hypothetical protein